MLLPWVVLQDLGHCYQKFGSQVFSPDSDTAIAILGAEKTERKCEKQKHVTNKCFFVKKCILGEGRGTAVRKIQPIVCLLEFVYMIKEL